jgi:phosphomannomutase
VLGHNPGPAVVNLSTSRLSEDAAEKHGCTVFRSPVGEVNVIEVMERKGADIGGEGNGGVIHRDCHLGRDSAVGMAYVVSYLREHPDMTVSDWADSFPVYINIKKKVNFSGDFSKMAIHLKDHLGEPDDITDGLWWRRIGGWLHIRPSGTEPVVRFIAENTDQEILDNDYALFRKVLTCVE